MRRGVAASDNISPRAGLGRARALLIFAAKRPMNPTQRVAAAARKCQQQQQQQRRRLEELTNTGGEAVHIPNLPISTSGGGLA